MRSFCFYFLLVAVLFSVEAQTDLFNQNITYSRADTLRGSITVEREWWNLLQYQLDVSVDIDNKFLSGTNTIRYEVLNSHQLMQIDLQSPMNLVSAVQNGKTLPFTQEGNVYFIEIRKKQKPGVVEEIVLQFEGAPREAVNAPWDGGFTWTKDDNGNHFVANSNQGVGASVWWPCKDHGYDEPENGLLLNITVPKDLVAVGNGRLVEVLNLNDQKTYMWKVVNPINNYGVNINIGDYVNFSETYEGEKGALEMEYWVLRDNLEKAKKQFKQAPMTIEAFEYWFGPYPFYEDSYKLVEVPYLGMEHQSSVTYGNNYKNGYNGRGRGSFDFSGTGWGLKWDYIIIHETGHEWFANNITAKDVADLWVHEGFTCYSESLYIEYHFGSEAAEQYTIGTRRVIANQDPLIGDYGVNKEGSSDMYFKGNNILHTLRNVINDDEKWRSILRGLNSEFYHQTVTSEQVERYISDQSEMDLSFFFDQYLRQASIPTLTYKVDNDDIYYKWTNVIEGFNMPVDVIIDGKEFRVTPESNWKTIHGDSFQVDKNFYVQLSEND